MVTKLREEKKLWKRGYKVVVGLDEAGRGPLAGPVVAAAVCIIRENPKFQITWTRSGLPVGLHHKQIPCRQRRLPGGLHSKSKIQNTLFKDSKKLTPKRREELYKILVNHPQIKWAIGRVGPRVIDRINIKNAAELAMERAVQKLKVKSEKLKVDFLIIDGNHLKNLQLTTYNLQLLIKADEKVFSCMAAGIIAKTKRDAIMKREHKKYPQYGFNKHKGYPTKFHKKQLKKYGLSPIHRKTFSPCKNLRT